VELAFRGGQFLVERLMMAAWGFRGAAGLLWTMFVDRLPGVDLPQWVVLRPFALAVLGCIGAAWGTPRWTGPPWSRNPA
jgi:hypothetical protein